MPDALHILVLTVVAFASATLGAITGFGGAAVLLPALAWAFGVREAIPILTVAQLIGNGSRVVLNIRAVQWKVVFWFAVGGIPLALLGGYLFAKAPLTALTRVLGVFLLVVVLWRHLRPGKGKPFRVEVFAAIGAGGSFLSALLGSVGPVMAPFFLSYGLFKAAYIGTEALCTVVMHVTKLIAYQQTSLLTRSGALNGLALGPIMILGSFVGKKVVDRLPERVFIAIIEGVLIVAGLLFLIRGR